MYTIAKKFAFSASHTIGGLSPEHPCGRLHGHNYEVEVILQAAALDGAGFVRDYRELAPLKKFLDETVDHNHLNDVLGHDATTAGSTTGVKRAGRKWSRFASANRRVPGRNIDRDRTYPHQ